MRNCVRRCSVARRHLRSQSPIIRCRWYVPRSKRKKFRATTVLTVVSRWDGSRTWRRRASRRTRSTTLSKCGTLKVLCAASKTRLSGLPTRNKHSKRWVCKPRNKCREELTTAAKSWMRARIWCRGTWLQRVWSGIWLSSRSSCLLRRWPQLGKSKTVTKRTWR